MTDRLSADKNNEAEARTRQAALEQQSDEIGELDKKLIEIKEKSMLGMIFGLRILCIYVQYSG